MPEGHTVHRSARDLGALRGRVLRASSPQGRFAAGAAVLDGDVLESSEAYGKHLLLRTAGEANLHVHLGMQGKWLRGSPVADPLPQVRLRLGDEKVVWDLVAPSRCELLDDDAVARLVSGLGPDPLRDDAAEARAIAALSQARGAIGAALLDQSVVAGVGNVFRNEALHAVGVAPARPSRDLPPERLAQLWSVLRRMMRQAVEDGRIVTVEGPDRLSVPEGEARKVYKQDRCRDCGAEVVVSQVGGRTAYHCPVEQPGTDRDGRAQNA